MKCVSVNFTVETPVSSWDDQYSGWRVLKYEAVRMMSGSVYWNVQRTKTLEQVYPSQPLAEQAAKRTGIYRPTIYHGRRLDDCDLVQFMLEEMEQYNGLPSG